MNRVQKLRKSAGLRTNDQVQVLYTITGDGDEEFIHQMLDSQGDYISKSLGCIPTIEKDDGHVVFGRDNFEISSALCMNISVVRPKIKMDSVSVQGSSKVDEIEAILSAREYCTVAGELFRGEMKDISLNGATVCLSWSDRQC